MKRSLVDASIILAGASGGLGRQIGLRLEKAGARLVLLARNEAKLSALDLTGPRVVGDLADAETCRRAVAHALAAHGRLDGVVNAAGVVAFGAFDELKEEVLDELLLTNLIGPTRLMQAALPSLEPGGFIANVSAVVAERPMAGMAFYSATKAALTALDQALARELRRQKVDVIDVRPPHTETGLVQRAIAGMAPRLPEGHDPEVVAARIVSAIEAGEREVPSDAF